MKSRQKETFLCQKSVELGGLFLCFIRCLDLGGSHVFDFGCGRAIDFSVIAIHADCPLDLDLIFGKRSVLDPKGDRAFGVAVGGAIGTGRAAAP